jgi:hypothetical protein
MNTRQRVRQNDLRGSTRKPQEVVESSKNQPACGPNVDVSVSCPKPGSRPSEALARIGKLPETLVSIAASSERSSGPVRSDLAGARLLVRQAHDECQSNIQSRDVPVVEMTDLSSNSLPPNGDGLVKSVCGGHSSSSASWVSLPPLSFLSRRCSWLGRLCSGHCSSPSHCSVSRKARSFLQRPLSSNPGYPRIDGQWGAGFKPPHYSASKIRFPVL